MKEKYSAKVAMLSNVIDYAGTFPPASSTLEEALSQACTFRRDAQHPWLMGRLTLKWSDIKTIAPAKLFQLGADGSPWLFTALGSEAAESSDWERVAEWELREIRNYNARHGGASVRLWVVGYEAKIPSMPSTETPARLASYLDRFWEATGGEQSLYLEVPFGEGFAERLVAVIESLGRWLEDRGISKWSPGLKFRMAGSYVPSPDEVATAILQTTYARFRFKATQGLHGAVTHGGNTGFVNLFAAIHFAHTLGSESFGRDEVVACLTDDKPAHFLFRGNTFLWKKRELSVDEIETARRFHAATFGSCSVSEPDASLGAVLG